MSEETSATARAPLVGRIVALVGRIGPAGWRRLDLVVAIAVFGGLTTPVLLGHPDQDAPKAVVLAFGAAAALPLAVRRRHPLTALVVIVTATVVAELLGVRFTPYASNTSPSVGLAMYSVATAYDRRLSLKALGATAAVTFATSWIATYAHPEDEANAVHLVAAVIGWLAGDAVHSHRRYRNELEARRRREDDERTRRAIAEERLQISREVHDVISHNLSAIAVRSGVGRMLFDTRPEEARVALAEVETVSRGALTELRRLLDTVRESSSLTPPPRLADLPELLEQVTSLSGIQVTLELLGEPSAFRPTLELSAYRIVQESLTNVIKHAGPTSAQVTVGYREDVLHIEVTDEGDRAPTASDQGWGIVGMRERAAVFGGTVDAGPRPGGGFRVSARLPVNASREER